MNCDGHGSETSRRSSRGAGTGRAVIVFGVVPALVVSGLTGCRSQGDREADAWSTFSSTLGPERRIETRVCGRPVYAPMERRRGPTGTEDRLSPPPSWQVLSAYAELARLARERRSPNDQALFGRASLLMGHEREAVGALEESLRGRPDDLTARADLGAALIERARAQDRPEDLIEALETLDKIVESAESPIEARFNLALVIEELGLTDQAIEAWRDVERRETSAEWRAEAARRREDLQRRARRDTRETAMQNLDDALHARDTAVLHGIVGERAEDAREHLAKVLLPEWAGAVLENDLSRARASLGMASLLAHALADVTGDRLDLEAVVVLERIQQGDSEALRRAALGHDLYGRGKSAIDRRDFSEARALFTRAERELATAGSPFAEWARYQALLCGYFGGDAAGSYLKSRARLEILAGRPYPILQGHLEWMQGLVQVKQSNVGHSLPHYERALALLNSAKQVARAAGVRSCIAENLDLLGDPNGAWSYRVATLGTIDDSWDLNHVHFIYMQAATACESIDRPRTGLRFLSEGIALSRKLGAAPELVNDLVWQAAVLQRLGRTREAASTLEETRALITRIPGAMRARMDAELALVEGLALERDDPPTAIAQLTHALDHFTSEDVTLRLAEIHLHRARARIALGDLDDAERDLDDAIGAFEGPRTEIAQERFRISYFDLSRETFDEMIALQALFRHRPERALAFAERARARQMLDALERPKPESPSSPGGRAKRSQGSLPSIALAASRVPKGAAAVSFRVLEQSTIVWLVEDGRVEMFVRPIGSTALGDLVRSFDAALARRAPEGETDEVGAKLYDALIQPLAPRLSGIETLILIPDGSLHALPFAALRNGRSGRRL